MDPQRRHHLCGGDSDGPILMEFLVRITVNVPPGTAAEEEQRLRAAELAVGRRLAAEGSIQRIWRIPGTKSNVGIWQAADAEELHRLVCSLPLFPWLDVNVQVLARHPVEERNDIDD